MDKQTELLSEIFYSLYNDTCKNLESQNKLPVNRKIIHDMINNALCEYLLKLNQETIINDITNQI